MARGTLIKKVQRKADLKSTKLPAHEVSRVSRLVLDAVEREMDRLEVKWLKEDWDYVGWTDLRGFIVRKKRSLGRGR